MNKFHFIYYKFILGIFLFKLGIFEWEFVNKDIDYKFILIGSQVYIVRRLILL